MSEMGDIPNIERIRPDWDPESVVEIKYAELEKLESLRSKLEIKTLEPLQAAADTFKANVERVLNTARLPGEMFNRGFHYHGLQQRLGQWRKAQGWEEMDDAARESKFEEYLTRNAESEADFAMSSLDKNQSQYPAAVDALARFQYSRHVADLMASMITGAWTAHEVLTADLWVAALNLRPMLGFVALNAKPEDDDDDELSERKGNVKFEFRARDILKWKSELGNRMGSLLREKWRFSRRASAVDAYYRVFRESKAKLKPILEDQGVRWLAATRNAIVHNGGIADGDFVSQVRSHAELKLIDDLKPISSQRKSCC